jgi:hypothetical protein
MKLYDIEKWTDIIINSIIDWKYTFLWIDWAYWKWKNEKWDMFIFWNPNHDIELKDWEFYLITNRLWN